MAWAAIPGIIAAAGSLASTGEQIAGSGSGRPPQKRTVPLPPYIDALQHMTARWLAENMTAQPPSFADYIGSGGTAHFGSDVQMSPMEAVGLGLVSRKGRAVPFMDPKTGKPMGGTMTLSPEQLLYLAQQYHQMNRPRKAERFKKEYKRETKGRAR